MMMKINRVFKVDLLDFVAASSYTTLLVSALLLAS